MDFASAQRLATCLSRDYAGDLLRLLVNYRDVSASEAASRLNLHIRTAQEFLEALTELGILTREEVFERKRPYFRYTLAGDRISLDLDLRKIFRHRAGTGLLARAVRERKASGARFVTAREGERIASLSVSTGSGRDRRERRISLTAPQGRFLYHLPFPTAAFMSVREIMQRAGVGDEHRGAIAELLDLLEEYGVIEEHHRPA
jgi:hypothetical protein